LCPKNSKGSASRRTFTLRSASWIASVTKWNWSRAKA
jgi:hypothetical protein